MKASVLAVTIALAASGLLTTVSAGRAAGPYSNYLTVMDVQGATAIRGLTVKDTATGLEFDDDKGKGVLEVRFDKPSLYQAEVLKNPAYYKAVAGVGEKAAIAGPGRPYRVTFVKGKFCVIVQSIPQLGKDLLNRDQLIAVAKIVAGRL